MMETKEGAVCYEHLLDHAVEFFGKAGSLMDIKGKESFYEGNETALSLFQKTWIVDTETSMKLLFWLRDCRGGAGNRSGFRNCLRWLSENDPSWVKANMHLIIESGRWDDLTALFGTELESLATQIWGDAIYENNGLAVKWAKREHIPIMKYLKRTYFSKNFFIGDFRRYLAQQRKKYSNIVETKMCNGQWEEINYEQVPSVAMSRYTNAFTKHDEEGFNKFQSKVEKGEAKINASVLFPHNCVITALNGKERVASLQFEALPNYMEEADERIMCICDTSWSMTDCVSSSKSVQCYHVSIALALYCSDRLGKKNPFYRKFIAFNSESKFQDWSAMSFHEAVKNDRIFDGAVGSTRIDKALDSILKTAKFFSLPKEFMPTTLLILSDMQFHQGGVDTCIADSSGKTMVEACMLEWIRAGYNVPKIIYWNLKGYAGSPATVKTPNTALISGFSPSVLKAVFGGDDLSAKGCMMRAIDKYKVIIPS